jgi:hypothetical protein
MTETKELEVPSGPSMKGTQAGRSGAHSSLARCCRLKLLLLDVCILALPCGRHHTEGVHKGVYDLVELEVMKSRAGTPP